ncbi:S1 family peptidase [Amycolatopsis magusensis]|uniref:Streptogrisin D n=1 Tax=Amycolatopsis magusensis TaxID=882444 RepID=A0ABS4PLQ6_9PSEU|nr:S1 family peptidase [Amycolatopsis magusensis]MBP2180362.1 streptogrisin D [Amycolatopsis magusensis]
MKITTGRRRLAQSAVALLAGATAIGFLTPATAAAGVDGYAAEVADAAVASVTAKGLTEAQAKQLLNTQEARSTTLNTALGALGDRQAGGFFEADGTPVVNVLDATAAEQVAATGAVAKVVKHSAAQLESAQTALEAVPAVAHTSIGKDATTNQIVVTIADAAQGTDALLAEVGKLGDQVRVQHVAGEMTPAILNGEAITGGGSRCSAGFNTNKGGQNYIVDAGHCTGAVANWDGIGPSVEASFPGNDYGLIQNNSGDAPGAVTLWNGSSQPITSAGNATQGQEICKSGSTTNLTCGSVTATDVTVNYPQGAVDGLIQTSASVNSGDSGGCLFAGSVGVGITSGMGGGSSFFQPVTEALGAYGVTLN